ncbi:MAG: hypothetical protein AB1779_10150 [Candidatus Thermoplasmatota archaeon]
MFEWITSKVVMSIAAIILIISIAGFFQLQRSSYEVTEFNNTAIAIANIVDDVSNSPANLKQNVTFGYGGGIKIMRNFRGNPYELEFLKDRIILRQGTTMVTKGFIKNVHLWKPETSKNISEANRSTKEELAKLDSDNKNLKFKSGNDFVIEGKLINVSGNNEFHTFIYLRKI